MNVTPKTNKLHDWIDSEVPSMIDDEMESKAEEIVFDNETLKQIETEVTKLLK